MYILNLLWFVLTFFSLGISDAGHPGGHRYVFNLKKSYITWRAYEVSGNKIGGHFGRFFLKDGKMIIDKSKPVIAKGEFDINMESVVCDDIKSKVLNKKFVEHLKNEDFFSVKKFPIATVKIDGVDFSLEAYSKKTDGTFEYKTFDYKSTAFDKKMNKESIEDLNKTFESLEDLGYQFIRQGIAKSKVEFMGKKKEIKFPISVFSLAKPKKNYITEEYDAHDTVMVGGFVLNRRDFGINYMSSDANKAKYIKDLVDISFTLYSMGIEPDFFFFKSKRSK